MDPCSWNWQVTNLLMRWVYMTSHVVTSYKMSRPSWSRCFTPTAVTNLCWEGSPIKFGAEPVSVTALSLHWSGCYSAPLCWTPSPSTTPLGEPSLSLFLGDRLPRTHLFLPKIKNNVPGGPQLLNNHLPSNQGWSWNTLKLKAVSPHPGPNHCV